MPCRFASSGTVAISRSASRAILALNAASNFLRDLVISVLHRLRQSRTLHTLTFGPISGGHFTHGCTSSISQQASYWAMNSFDGTEYKLINEAAFSAAATASDEFTARKILKVLKSPRLAAELINAQLSI